MQAKDVMTTDVVTVNPNDEVGGVARLLLDHRISAVPVVEPDGRIVGIVGEGDLMRRAECGAGRSWWLALLADKTTVFTRTHGTRARDVMTREVLSVEEDTPISDVARTLETHRIKRMPVLRSGRLVGIVSRADILRGLAVAGTRTEARPSADDRQLRARILDLIGERTSASDRSVSVIVVNGAAYLWGVADSAADKDAIRIAAENVAGPKHVHDFTSTLRQVLGAV